MSGACCPSCGRVEPRRGHHDGHAKWMDPWGHRCPHGEPCRGNGKSLGASCSQCEQRDLTVCLLPEAIDYAIVSANVEMIRETGIGPELPADMPRRQHQVKNRLNNQGSYRNRSRRRELR